MITLYMRGGICHFVTVEWIFILYCEIDIDGSEVLVQMLCKIHTTIRTDTDRDYTLGKE